MTDKEYVDLYYYEYYQGIWKTYISTRDDLHVRNASKVFVTQITLPSPVKPEHLAWLANLGFREKDLNDPIKGPDDVVISAPTERQFSL